MRVRSRIRCSSRAYSPMVRSISSACRCRSAYGTRNFTQRSRQMSKAGTEKAVDRLQQRLTEYTYGLSYDQLPRDVAHAAKVRIIDTLGALIGGFFGDPSQVCRKLAAQMPDPNGATVIGTRMKTTPDMAAFVNATTGR